jgi:hypothetical protein
MGCDRALSGDSEDYSPRARGPTFSIASRNCDDLCGRRHRILGGCLFEISRTAAVGYPIFGVVIVVAGLVSTLLGGWLGDRLRLRYPGSYFPVSGVGFSSRFPY